MSFAGEEDTLTMSYVGKSGRVEMACKGGKMTSEEKSYQGELGSRKLRRRPSPGGR